MKSCVVALFLCLVSPFSALGQTLSVSWEVENRFRFYKDPTIFREYLAVAKAHALSRPDWWLVQTERSLQTGQGKVLAAKEAGWAANSLREEALCWSPIKRPSVGYFYDRNECKDYISPVSHRVLLSVSGPLPSGATCRWTIRPVAAPTSDLWKLRAKGGLVADTGECRDVVALVPYHKDVASNGADVVVTVSVNGHDTVLPVLRVGVKDILIAGLGDSFGAGVGNPDVPARIDAKARLFYSPPGFDRNVYGAPFSPDYRAMPVRAGASKHGLVSDPAFTAGAARWTDVRCFRSQYGPQFRAALHLGVASPHAAVTFLDLACDGARILEGLMSSKLLSDGQVGKVEPQLEAVAKAICRVRSPGATFQRRVVTKHTAGAAACRNGNEICEFPLPQYRNNPGLSRIDLKGCNEADAHRLLDYVFLSIGGNDIGFAPLVGYAVIRDFQKFNDFVDGATNKAGLTQTPATGDQRLALLRDKYQHLSAAIASLLPLRDGATGQNRILITSYPLPVGDENGRICGTTSTNQLAADQAMNVESNLGGFGKDYFGTPGGGGQKVKDVLAVACRLDRWRFAWMNGGLDPGRAAAKAWMDAGNCKGSDVGGTAPHAPLPWSYVAGHMEESWARGFCASKPDTALTPQAAAAEALSMPGYQIGLPLASDPYEIKNFRAYHTRTRWVRTPNDAFLISNWHKPGKQATRKNAQTAAATSALHMTAEGYAAMGNALFRASMSHLCATGGAIGELLPDRGGCATWGGGINGPAN